MSDQTYVVAGNGTSLAHSTEGRVLNSDKIVRTNNFFFEPQSYLGHRVDLAVMGGDPRVAPFVFETLWRCRSTYDLRAWTSHNPHVVRSGKRRFSDSFRTFPMPASPLAEKITVLIRQYDSKPMTGTYAVMAGLGLGATSILLTGFDLYQRSKRYSYDAGPRQKGLLGTNLNTRQIDDDQHDIDLDLAIIDAIQDHSNGAIQRLTTGSMLDDLMDLAPLRDGPGPTIQPTNPPTDWAGRAGLYPLAALRLMRRVRRGVRRT